MLLKQRKGRKRVQYDFLIETPLFQGMAEAEAKAVLHCLQGVCRSYQKGEAVYRAGDRATALGLLLSGSVHIESGDAWGNRTILSSVGPGQVFAETYACVQQMPLMVDVVAAENCEILFLQIEKVLTTCPDTCGYHARLLRNLLSVLALKNLNLTHKIFHTSPKSIREKLSSYLSFQAVRQGSRRFQIPFNRQQLADYLGVDRSALSNTLRKMQQEGLLMFEKNAFCLLEHFPGSDAAAESRPDRP